MKRLLLITVALFIVGCSSKQSRYLLPQEPTATLTTTSTQIGVTKVKLPSYLNSDKILIKDGLKLEELNANFATSPDKLFTNRAIVKFKKLLNDPNVFLYPWDVDSKKGYIVTIVLDDFIYSNNSVTLSGSYFIKSATGKSMQSANFSYEKLSNKNADEIMRSLGELFDKVVLEIAQKIAR